MTEHNPPADTGINSKDLNKALLHAYLQSAEQSEASISIQDLVDLSNVRLPSSSQKENLLAVTRAYVSALNELVSQLGLDEKKSLSIEIDLQKNSSADAVAAELVTLCKALNAYHIACGGNGLEIDDWGNLVAVRELAGV